ncbi:hypothetical protein [Streptomyces xanthochromogenes]
MTTATALQSGREHRTELLALTLAATTQLTDAWSHLATAQAALLVRLGRIQVSQHNTGSIAAARVALADFNRAVGDFERAARAVAARWTATDLPAAYRDGALRALRTVGRPLATFTWSAHHQAAVTALSAQYYADLITRITEAVRRAQAFARAARDQARTREGVNSGELLAAHPLDVVVYQGKARHPVRNWARAALAWQAVTAANAGALNLAHYDLATQWMEIADGPECGWTTHDDLDRAHGTIRSVDDCAAYPASHPGCIRQLIPRPDLTGRTDIASGDSP